jgi:predicted O-methyltransferase YrrM
VIGGSVSIEAWQRDRETLRRYFDDAPTSDAAEADHRRADATHYAAAFAEQERLFERIFALKPKGLFLEVGIGEAPVKARIAAMLMHGIAYTGLDFDDVCARHRPDLEEAHRRGLSFRLIGNRAGSYLYNLFDLMRAGETFDVIYFDGHHTMNVDAGPLLVASMLLEPDGILVIDDVAWTLSQVARNMFLYYREWLFYRRIYDFDLYEPNQLREPHIGLLVDQVLIRRLGFVADPALALPGKAVLRRGAG